MPQRSSLIMRVALLYNETLNSVTGKQLKRPVESRKDAELKIKEFENYVMKFTQKNQKIYYER